MDSRVVCSRFKASSSRTSRTSDASVVPLPSRRRRKVDSLKWKAAARVGTSQSACGRCATRRLILSAQDTSLWPANRTPRCASSSSTSTMRWRSKTPLMGRFDAGGKVRSTAPHNSSSTGSTRAARITGMDALPSTASSSRSRSSGKARAMAWYSRSPCGSLVTSHWVPRARAIPCIGPACKAAPGMSNCLRPWHTATKRSARTDSVLRVYALVATTRAL